MITVPRGIQRFVPVATGQYAVAGGGAGWIDTDVSATTGTNTRRLWLIQLKAAASNNGGCRAHGSAVDNKSPVNLGTLFLSYVDDTGHMDLYRDANNNDYYIMGYLE